MHRATGIAIGVLALTLVGMRAQEAAKPPATPSPKPAQGAAKPPTVPALTVAKSVTAPAAAKSNTATPTAAKPATPTPAAAAKPVAATPAPAASPTIPFNRGVVVLDAAHGGTDNGSRLTDSLVEKDVTLGLAFKLRSLLAARGFTVIMTRDGEGTQTDANAPVAVLGLDDRAGMANHAHAVACLLLHATAAGQGVHLYSSELAATGTQPTANPWLSAQAPWVTESQNLEKSLGVALHRSNINIIMSRGSVRPLDSLTCPALVVELAPDGDDADTLNDGEYQQKVAAAMAGALLNWKNDAQPPLPATAGVQP